MRWTMVALASCLTVAGCVGGTSMAERQDEDVQSALQYDDVPCDQLIAQRNALAQQSNLPVTAKTTFSNPAMGFGPFMPDTRSKAERDRNKASGQIDAMNRSIERRDCGKPKKKESFGLPGSKLS
ncbi:hypothetical protein FJ987_08860 [Mesorhizobium sp. CU2]|uniref:hypothetical protein n=1 Tax=unclassified Mesorhizobium TaxID=325217 RepID=UPI00112BC8AC|nr:MULTISPECIES: hypothetical protein [unclassified Mesorhizobium]TPN89604.1 hypothetical protein FJ988_01420 [Mesorhizobium sp. CU3]TPO17833.1 hypothetical protein FJ987_08860 [Mesorhizobium sp. CU2]